MINKANKILITGAAGYIGSHATLQLITDPIKYEIVSIDNFYNSYEKVILTLKNFNKDNLEFFKIDMCNFNELLQLFQKFKPDIVCVVPLAPDGELPVQSKVSKCLVGFLIVAAKFAVLNSHVASTPVGS